MFEHIMVDLETLSSREDAAILSIGAVRFDLEQLSLGEEFYERVELASCEEKGLRISADTLLWWMEQTPEARKVFIEQPQISLLSALSKFKEFVATNPNSVIWGNGATFDNMILRNAFRACGLSYPVSYRNDLCYRTMRRMFPVIKSEGGVVHNALDDARNQASTLLSIMKNIRS
jgi:hypothetical protein